VAPGEREARLDHSLLLPARVEDVLPDLAPGGGIHARVAERQLEEGTLGRQRRTQLVRDMGSEPLSPLEHHGCVPLGRRRQRAHDPPCHLAQER
jgi:hypothetical protein